MVASSIIEKAFTERPDLKKRTYDAIAQSPQHTALFNDIANYTQSLRSPSNPAPNGAPTPSKKRKLDDPISTNGTSRAPSADWKPGYPSVPDTSFLIPQRKKLTLEISPHSDEGLRARNPSTGAVEFGLAWKDVQHAVCVPVPEKAQRQHAFCVFPACGDGVSSAPEGAAGAEPMVWTVPDAVPKGASLAREGQGEGAREGMYKDYMRGLLDAGLGRVARKVVEPEEREFASALVQAHRKGERAFHVGAFRGSKDGFLFFLPTGILYAFKKPLLFFAFDAIDSVSYTSVLQRTFNLNVTTSTADSTARTGPEEPAREFEFAMLDQADFAGIDAYVKRHGLQDASMAEQRRAKRLNVNGVKRGEDGGEGIEGDGELERARKEVEAQEGEIGNGNGDEGDDDEDEGEEGEDYDPGSEGESEGSGTSSEEEGAGDGVREGRDQGLMEDELRSAGEEEEEL